MSDQTPPAEQAPPEPTAEEQRESLADAQAQGETTSPQAQQQQERDVAEPDAEQAPDAPAPTSSDEQAARAAHSAEGGGAWPPELLAKQGVQPQQAPDYDALREQQAAEAEAQGGEES